ncbi:MAG: glycosyltransferase [Ignavibacteria bacterium]|nr:glycosyltransferase [Ignavibacteria bacterium]
MFKVLVIAYYFPPKGLSGVQRTLKFVKYMPKFEWQPTVLTSDDNAYFAYDHSLMNDIDPEQVRVVRVAGNEINSKIPKKGNISFPSEFLRKVFSFFSMFFYLPDNKKGWSKVAIDEARKLLREEHFDLVFVSGPPFSSVMMAAELKKEFGIPVTADYRDLWYGAQFVIYPTPFHKSMVKSMEYRTIKTIDKLFVTNRQIKEKIMEYYPFIEHRDVIIIPHGYDPDDIQKAGTEHRPADKMIITFSGLFYASVTPKYILNAFYSLLRTHPHIAANIQFQFIGIWRKSINKQVKKLKLEAYVTQTGYITHLEAVRKLNSSDILLMTINKARNYDTISAGKIFEYIGTRKPIIGLVYKGAIQNALQEYGASYIADPADENQIKELLIKVYTDYANNRLPKPNEEVVEKYRRDNITETLTKEFQFIVSVR